MTFDPYGYGYTRADPRPRAARPGAYQGPPLEQVSPPAISYVTGNPVPPKHHPVRDAAISAAVAIAVYEIWQRMKKRKARVGEYTHPLFRFFLYFWAPVFLGFLGLTACLHVSPPALAGVSVTQGWVDLGNAILYGSCVIGFIWSWGYLAWRFTGHGRYNPKR